MRPNIQLMTVREQIAQYIASQPELKRSDMQQLDTLIRAALPGAGYGLITEKTPKVKWLATPTSATAFTP